MFNKYFLVILMLLISSCGPIYETSYSYYPPKEETSRYCLSSCSGQRQSCSSNCSDRKQTCEIAERSLDLAENVTCNKRKNYCNNNPNASGCVFDKSMDCDKSRSSYSKCDNTYDECKNECLSFYNQCYINCGGKVQTDKVCVHFCN